MLERLAAAAGELMAGLKDALDVDALHRIQDGIGESLIQLNLVGAEARTRGASFVAPRPCDDWPRCRCALAPSLAGTARPAHGCCCGSRRFSSRERSRAPRSTPSSLHRWRGIRTRLLCGSSRHGSQRRSDAASAYGGDGAFLRALLRAGADASRLARSPSLRGGMGAITGQMSYPVCAWLTGESAMPEASGSTRASPRLRPAWTRAVLPMLPCVHRLALSD